MRVAGRRNAAVVFLILGIMFSLRGDPMRGFAAPSDKWAAFLAAALFAVHPLATESVDYISSQSVPLAAFFNLLAFYLFLTVYGRGALPAGAGARWRSADRGLVLRGGRAALLVARHRPG